MWGTVVKVAVVTGKAALPLVKAAAITAAAKGAEYAADALIKWADEHKGKGGPETA